MDEIFALYHRPTVAREYATAEDFAAQVIGAEDTDGLDLEELDAAARAFWRECRATGGPSMTRDDYTEPDGVYECERCGEECDAYAEDVGIGAYEFWGVCGVDRRIEWSSRCCDAPVYQIR